MKSKQIKNVIAALSGPKVRGRALDLLARAYTPAWAGQHKGRLRVLRELQRAIRERDADAAGRVRVTADVNGERLELETAGE